MSKAAVLKLEEATQQDAPRPVPDAPTSDLRPFQDGLPVRLIATPRAAFSTCTPNEGLADVVARNKDDQFDYFPVVEVQQDYWAGRPNLVQPRSHRPWKD